ncbi:DUF4198 domain-containing protein [Dyadobacter sp. 3J3]|uniref:DUF4198 domain-containing protein n=1 Tax=Dyadobacter sp. 3J3 TaxID=2606600 RepID=UPI0013597FD6|nr:DUF4198 domain-containing protein [Dyadobacter sp. 3J3]
MLKNRKTIVVVSLMLLATLGYAHEFWMEPMKFILKENEKVLINLMVGEDYQGEDSNGLKYKILKLDHYSGNTSTDIRATVKGDSLSSFDIIFTKPGNHLIAFNNTSKFIGLESGKFNDYLRSEGLDEILKLRLQKGDTLKPGRELYQRCVKTLVQVGGKNDQTFAINTGMKLEIIPKTNPYAVTENTPVTFKIMFLQKPVKNGLVLAWHVQNGKATHQKLRSNAAGEVTFPISRTGKWMISTVHMTAHANSTEADWQSYWGSYTFGFF